MKTKQKRKKIKAAIFDLDGVLVDTETIGINVCSDLIKRKFRIRLNKEDKAMFYGLADLEYYKRLLRRYHIDSDPMYLLDEHNQEYDHRISDMKNAIPGVAELIKQFSKNNVRLAICSGSYLDQIKTILGNLDLESFFDVIVSCEMTLNHKPHPDPYLLALRLLKIKPDGCIAFEDSENGVQSAKKAGIYCVGVNIGNHGTQNLRKSGADHEVYTLEDFLRNTSDTFLSDPLL